MKGKKVGGSFFSFFSEWYDDRGVLYIRRDSYRYDLGSFIIDEGYVIYSCNKVSSLQTGFD